MWRNITQILAVLRWETIFRHFSSSSTNLPAEFQFFICAETVTVGNVSLPALRNLCDPLQASGIKDRSLGSSMIRSSAIL